MPKHFKAVPEPVRMIIRRVKRQGGSKEVEQKKFSPQKAEKKKSAGANKKARYIEHCAYMCICLHDVYKLENACSILPVRFRSGISVVRIDCSTTR